MPFVWTEDFETSFQDLKDKMVPIPVLTMPDDTGNYIIYNDASKKGLECVMQRKGLCIRISTIERL